uniref:Vitamin D 25-hydroxylase-like n=1 Tax=Phallusia mammillata TaxID=59560 RepID=A0A6F9DA87_9ASCI|nr:vitamin D 25-hydroxylase-like [Phallusia mammillata]
MEILPLLAGNLTSVLIGSCVVLVYLFFRLLPKRPKNFPPGPDGFPLVGVAPYLGKRPDMKLTEYAQKYGDIMGIRIGTQYHLILSGADVLYEACAKQGDVYSARPWSFLHDVIWGKNGISMTDFSDDWKEQRKFVLTSLRKFGFGKTSLEGPIADEARYLGDALRKCEGDYEQGKHNFMDAMANVICKLALGTRFDYDDDRSFIQFARNVTNRFQNASFSLIACIMIPWCHHFPPVRKPLRDMDKLFVKMHATMKEYIVEHKKTFNRDDPQNFLDEYLVELEKNNGKPNGLFNETMLKYILRDLFLGGLETLFSTLTWSLLILANRPEVQKKLQNEIDEIMGREGRPTLRHKEEMHFTLAFMQEVLRYRTLLPFGVARMTIKDTKLMGYDIPKGTTVISNLYGVHNDPKVWKDPLTFKVERHLNSDGEFFKDPNVMPFGIGYRYCLGKQLAEMEFFLFLTSIMQNFNVSSGTGKWQYEDLLEVGFVSTPPPTTDLRLTERV